MAPEPKDKLKAPYERTEGLTIKHDMNSRTGLPRRRLGSDSLTVYSCIYPWRVNSAWWLLLLLGPAGVAVFSILPGNAPAVFNAALWAVSALACSRLLASGLFWLVRYGHFRHWRKRLLIRVEGWHRMVNSYGFRDPSQWRPCTIQLHLLYHASLDDPELQRILRRFCDEANNSGFPASMSADPRHRWVLNDGQLRGSANCQVARLIYELCVSLSDLNRAEPTVESLLITTLHDGRPLEPLGYRIQ